MKKGLIALIVGLGAHLFGVQIPKNMPQMIVSIEVANTPLEQAQGMGAYRSAGTGFFVSPDTHKPFRPVMITAKHVLEGACQASNTVYLRHITSPKDANGNVLRYELKICERILATSPDGTPLKAPDGSPIITTRPLWIPHPSADLAAMRLPQGPNVPSGIMTYSPSEIVNDEFQKKWEIGASDETFILTFHPGVIQGEPSSPVIRHGTIASFSEGSDTFLVDSFIFPGNSGSPVILKPTVLNLINNTFNALGEVRQAYLIGVVVAYIPYTDIAISPQTQRARITFEENSGLVRVVRAEKVSELLNIVANIMGQQPTASSAQ